MTSGRNNRINKKRGNAITIRSKSKGKNNNLFSFRETNDHPSSLKSSNCLLIKWIKITYIDDFDQFSNTKLMIQQITAPMINV